ncbi:cobalamin biosynthesis protein [Nocardioides sp. SYSU D00065]|uniref:cobalamin biosynthesis protein n=1 Tax=Nocardioides sp. SYSU D00065 TaxID=2817378 RepID=UPI001B321117|nr:cobalamin biosynthesis protein [Nocardioides sp. SYSU D00065]
MTSVGVSRALGLVLGHLADRRLSDPRRGHPVAGFGRAAAALERRTYADSRARGVVHLTLLAGAAAGVGLALELRARRHPLAHTLLTAAATWTVLGGTSLAREASAVHDLLAADDLPGARRRLTHLVGRDTSVLDEREVSRAVVESVAENTSDAVVAPLVWGAVLGAPGLLGYRAANTLDAMIGHRGERYGRFGWASARFDDLLNLPGARLSGLLAAALAPTVGGRPSAALRAWARDARRHPSPNAGVVEAAFAGALGVRLGGRNHYAHGVEERVLLGDGPPPDRHDIDRSVRLAGAVGTGAVAVAAVLALRRGRD